MSDITGGIAPPYAWFDEVPTGKYEVGRIGSVWVVQRPDGSSCLANTMAKEWTRAIVAELERARLDGGSTCFTTLQEVARQRDALQVLLDAERGSNAKWATMMEAEHVELDKSRDQVEALQRQITLQAGTIHRLRNDRDTALADLEFSQELAGDLTKKVADTECALEASEMMRQTLGAEVGRLTRALEATAASAPVPAGYGINKDLGGWYFLVPGETLRPEDRTRWSSMEEAQIDARNHHFKATSAGNDPATGAPWLLNPIERKVVEDVHWYLDGWPDTWPVSIKANQNDGFFSIHIEKKDPREAKWADTGQPMSYYPWPPQAKPLSEMKFGTVEGREIDEETGIVRGVLREVPLRSEHADYIEATCGLKPSSLLRLQAWIDAPFSARVRAKVDLHCCDIPKGSQFEVVKDMGDGLSRLRAHFIGSPSPHFFDWDEVDAQLDMIKETTPRMSVDELPRANYLPIGYSCEKVGTGYAYKRLLDKTGEMSALYATREQAQGGAWSEALRREEVSPNAERAARCRVPEPPPSSSHWVISGPPQGRQLYRATLVSFNGEDFQNAGETMHAENLTIIRQKVLHWFRTRKQPAACVPREELDAPHIIETWL